VAFSGRWRTTDSFTRTSRGARGRTEWKGKKGKEERKREREREREGEIERMRASERETGKESDRLTGGGNRPSLYGACSEVYKGLLY